MLRGVESSLFGLGAAAAVDLKAYALTAYTNWRDNGNALQAASALAVLPNLGDRQTVAQYMVSFGMDANAAQAALASAQQLQSQLAMATTAAVPWYKRPSSYLIAGIAGLAGYLAGRR